MSRRTAAVIERRPEEWVVVADGKGNEKHVLHIKGKEELEKVWQDFRELVAENARVDRKRWTDPLGMSEVTP